MADHDSQEPIVIEGVTLTKVLGTVKAVTSRSEMRTVGTDRPKSRSRTTVFGNVVTEHELPTTVTDTVRDFWVVSSKDGTEKHVETIAAVDVRDDHTVVLLLYNDSPTALANRDIGRWWALPEVNEALASKFGSHGKVSWKLLLIGLPVGLFIGLLLLPLDSPLLVALGLLIAVGSVYAGPIRLVLYMRAKQRYSRFLQGVHAMFN